MRDEQAVNVFVASTVLFLISIVVLAFSTNGYLATQNSVVKGKPMLYGDKVYMCGEVVLE